MNMILIVALGGVFLLLALAAIWVMRRGDRWDQDRAHLLHEIAELTEHSGLLAEHSGQAIVKFESTGAIRAVNGAAERLLGYAAEELLGQNIAKLTAETQFGSPDTEFLEVLCKDGRRVRLPFTSVKSQMIRRSYVYFFYIYLFFEVPAAEAEAAADSGLSGAANIVGRIAGQYETLLTTINGYSELALMETAEDSPLRPKLEEILSASEGASRLTRQLVAFSGKQFIPVAPLELNRVVTSMAGQIRGALGHPIDFDLQPTEQAILANEEYLREVVLLLCGSAGRRMRGGDRLRIHTGQCDLLDPRRVRSGELRPGVYGRLTVSDTGRPLDAQTAGRIFEPFCLIHEDMGVDLAPVYGIVQSLGGGIDVLAGEEGTTFEILLPCMDRMTAEDAPPVEELKSRAHSA